MSELADLPDDEKIKSTDELDDFMGYGKKKKNDSLYYRTDMYNVADLIEDATDVRVDHVFTEDVGHDGLISATFLSDGKFYYMEEAEPGVLYFERNDSATQELNDYAYGYFEAQGVRCDSIAPYYSLMEALRLDVNCSAGNKPCGSTCIPQRYTCNVGKGATGKAKKGMRSPGRKGFGRKAALAGAGLALAAGGGLAAYKNRDKIKAAGSAAYGKARKIKRGSKTLTSAYNAGKAGYGKAKAGADWVGGKAGAAGSAAYGKAREIKRGNKTLTSAYNAGKAGYGKAKAGADWAGGKAEGLGKAARDLGNKAGGKLEAGRAGLARSAYTKAGRYASSPANVPKNPKPQEKKEKEKKKGNGNGWEPRETRGRNPNFM